MDTCGKWKGGDSQLESIGFQGKDKGEGDRLGAGLMLCSLRAGAGDG